MGDDRKAAVITGASQGIGSALVEAYRERGYAVVSTARSVKPTNYPDMVPVPGDIADRRTAEETISQGLARRPHRHAGQQGGNFHRQTQLAIGAMEGSAGPRLTDQGRPQRRHQGEVDG